MLVALLWALCSPPCVLYSPLDWSEELRIDESSTTKLLPEQKGIIEHMFSPEPTPTSAFTSPSHLIATVNPVCYVLIVINLGNRSWGAVRSVGTTKISFFTSLWNRSFLDPHHGWWFVASQFSLLNLNDFGLTFSSVPNGNLAIKHWHLVKTLNCIGMFKI